MPAIISQVEGLGKSWDNCTRIRIKTPSPFKYRDGGDWRLRVGQAELWGRVNNLLLIHKSLERVKEASSDWERIIKSLIIKTLRVVFLFLKLGCRNPGRLFFSPEIYLAYFFKNYSVKKRNLQSLIYIQPKRILVRHYLSSQGKMIYLDDVLSIRLFSDARATLWAQLH